MGTKIKQKRDDLKFSVIVTCFKSGEDLGRAIDSLRHQTDQNFEIVIINDCSTDQLLNSLCLEFDRDSQISVYFNKTHLGISGSRNRGCQLMAGDIYIPLDGDDTLPLNAIELIRQTFLTCSEIDFVFGNYLRIDVEKDTETIVELNSYCNEDGLLNPRHIKIPPGLKMYGGSPFKKSMWLAIGGYDTKMDGREDVDFWLRAFLNGAKGRYVPHLLYIWHRSLDGINAHVRPDQWAELYLEKNWMFTSKYNRGPACIKRFINAFLQNKNYVGVKKIAFIGWRRYPWSVRFLGMFILPIQVTLFILRNFARMRERRMAGLRKSSY